MQTSEQLQQRAIGPMILEGVNGTNYLSFIDATGFAETRFGASSGVGYVAVDYQGSPLEFLTNPSGTPGVEVMRLTAAGSLGIGTTTPQATLDVAGQDRRKPVAFSALTACSGTIEGETAAVTNSDSNTWGDTVVHTSGSFHVLAYCDGTNWTVVGK